MKDRTRKKEESNLIQRGHQRVQEKVKEIRRNFAKAVTAGTRSGSGRIVYEFYDDLVSVWGDLLQQSHFLLECKPIDLLFNPQPVHQQK